MRIYLLGYMGSGKSTVGRQLARILNFKHTDLDVLFEEEYKNAVNDFLDLFHQEYTDYVIETDAEKVHKVYAPGNYLDYLNRDDADRVHNGYFSIDKKGKPVDSTI